MAKKKKQKKKTPQKPQKVAFWDTFSNAQKTGMCMVLIVVVVLIYFYPIVFQGQEPPASDSIAWRTNAQSLFEAREKYNYNPLWANNVFSGMPAHLISLLAPFEQPVRYIILAFEKIINWRALYYILGAIGFFLLMRFLACSHLVATLSSFAFIWWPNIIGLLEAGHNTKVRTIMFLPWILLTFLYFLKKPNLLHISLFALALSLGFRARHYQILFYCALILLFFGVKAIIPLIKEKQWKGIAIRAVPLLLAVLLEVRPH